MHWHYITIFVLLCDICAVSAQKWPTCTFNGLDFSKLKNPKEDYEIKVQSGTTTTYYYLNACIGLVANHGAGTTCLGNAGCQVWDMNNPKNQASLGNITSLASTSVTNGVAVSFSASAIGGREMKLTFLCDKRAKNNGIGEPKFLSENPKLDYNFEWSTGYACKGFKVPTDNGGLTGGGIFMILVACGAVAYVVGGIIVNKFVRHKEGIVELIPNVEFWISIPGLVKDGFKFLVNNVILMLVSKIRGNYSYQSV